MIAILSPARTIKHAALEGLAPTRPLYPSQTERLLELLRQYSPWELETLLRINPKLAMQTWEYYQSQDYSMPGIPAALAYRGLVYTGLDAGDFSLVDFAFARDHLRIFSAFYGMLRPTDGIHPYRLEMISRLQVDGISLYRFWGDRIYRDLFALGQPVINLCSEEYAKMITPYLKPQDPIVTCRFLVTRRGRQVVRTTAAKLARGNMARFIIEHRLEKPEQLKYFDRDDFAYTPSLSDSATLTFVQP